MSQVAQQPAPQSQQQIDATEAARLLDIVINRTPSSAGKAIADQLERNIEKLRELLPDYMKDQANRLVKRAIMYFERKAADFGDCTLASKIKAILEAAEMGLAIDGILCYAVPYNNKYTVVGADGKKRDEWRKEVQCQPSYKGLTVVARRTKQIADIYGDVIYKNDHFEHGRFGDKNICEHRYDLDGDRGELIGAYMIVKFPDGTWRYELMQLKELERIRNCSKMKNGPAWTQHPGEMYKKTVLRRALKLYCDDPGVLMAVEVDEREYTEDPNSQVIGRTSSKVGIDPLTEKLRPKAPEAVPAANGRGTEAEKEAESGIGTSTDMEASQSPAPDHQEGPSDPPGAPQTHSEALDDRRLSPLGVDFYDRLTDPKLTRDQNAVIMQELGAKKKDFEGDEFAFLQQQVDKNVERFAPKKRG